MISPIAKERGWPFLVVPDSLRWMWYWCCYAWSHWFWPSCQALLEYEEIWFYSTLVGINSEDYWLVETYQIKTLLFIGIRFEVAPMWLSHQVLLEHREIRSYSSLDGINSPKYWLAKATNHRVLLFGGISFKVSHRLFKASWLKGQPTSRCSSWFSYLVHNQTQEKNWWF